MEDVYTKFNMYSNWSHLICIYFNYYKPRDKAASYTLRKLRNRTDLCPDKSQYIHKTGLVIF